MNVLAILNGKGREVTTSFPETRLEEIAEILDKHNIGSIVIIDGDESVIGMISERDIVKAVAKDGPAVLYRPAAECMSTNVLTCCETDSLEKIMSDMTTYRVRHLPVIHNGRLVGLVSIGDVVKHRLAEAEMEAAAMRDYIRTG